MTAMPVSLLAWKSIPRNSLRGFAKIRIGKSLIISDVAVHCSNGRKWAQPPSKPVLNSEGVAVKDDRGKMKYIPMIEWADRDAADRFSEGVIAAVERENPGQTDSEYAI
ncbi:MAG: hypothetical protein NTX56_04325 [Proteobacteria bacterium]|nr:hypothetical protein [Pseudomonadota bacterium]